MFEDATFESMGTIHTRSRNWMLATFGLNGSIIAILIAVPFIYPSVLPQMRNTITLATPTPVEETHPVVRQTAPATSQTSEMYETRVIPPRRIPPGISVPNVHEDPGYINSSVLAAGPTGFPGVGCDPLNCGHAQTVVQQTAQPTRRVSGGVMEGMLLHRVLPVYPAMARATRTAGRVELQATISRTGTIENLRVVSGPQLLIRAAIDAVTQWRYRPYLLNAEPVEVETTINVDFTLD
jgi:periplasmic protein TonB